MGVGPFRAGRRGNGGYKAALSRGAVRTGREQASEPGIAAFTDEQHAFVRVACAHSARAALRLALGRFGGGGGGVSVSVGRLAFAAVLVLGLANGDVMADHSPPNMLVALVSTSVERGPPAELSSFSITARNCGATWRWRLLGVWRTRYRPPASPR